jgi:hypothetical protein
MGTWFSKVISALGGEQDGKQRAMHLLHAAQRARLKLNLEVNSGSNAVVLVTTVEQVRENDFVVSQPTIGGLTHPLAFGETIIIGIAKDNAYHTARSQCMGRVRIPSGGGGNSGGGAANSGGGGAPSPDALLYAYRLAMPVGVHSRERRAEPRIALRFTGDVEAQLYAHAMIDGPILGTIDNVSMSGASIITNLPPKRLQRGQTLYLKARLPDPGGLIDDLVTIAHMEVNAKTGLCTIGVQFQQRVAAIENLLRGAQPVAA